MPAAPHRARLWAALAALVLGCTRPTPAAPPEPAPPAAPPSPAPSTPTCRADTDCNYMACGCACRFFPPNARVRCPMCESGPPACAAMRPRCVEGRCALTPPG
ncbi:MAG: hypothetical protein R3A48_25270 [Polyangiales bacterium]